jgi:pyruvate dehydrogenase E1 component alpha subunit
MYVPVKDSHPVPDIAGLAQGYGMPGVVVDGQDVMAVAEAVQVAVERARQGKGPSMIEAKCERFCPHSVGVQDFSGADIRPAEEINRLRETRDPVKICRQKLLDQGVLIEEDMNRIQAEADAEVEAAEKFVDESPRTDPSIFEELLYAR